MVNAPHPSPGSVAHGSIPLWRRSWINSLLALLGLFGPLLLWLFVCFTTACVVVGLVLASALWIVCFNLTTGEVYYPDSLVGYRLQGRDRNAKTWSRGNRYLVWLLTLGQAAIVVLVASAFLFGTRSLERQVQVAAPVSGGSALELAEEIVVGLIQSGELTDRLSVAFPDVPQEAFESVSLGLELSKPLLVGGPATAAITISVPETTPPNPEAVMSVFEQAIRDAVERRRVAEKDR